MSCTATMRFTSSSCAASCVFGISTVSAASEVVSEGAEVSVSSCSAPALESDAVVSVPPAAGCASLALGVCSPLSSAAVLRSAAASSCVVMTESGAASSSVANELTGSRLNNSTSASSPACRLANRFFIIRVLPFLNQLIKGRGGRCVPAPLSFLLYVFSCCSVPRKCSRD